MPLYNPSGSSSAAWTVVSTTTISAGTANIPVDVTSYNDIILIGRSVVTTASVGRDIVVRTVAGGATYFETLGQYVSIPATGAEVNATGLGMISTASTAARSFYATMFGIRTASPLKFVQAQGITSPQAFVADTTQITHVRLQVSSGTITSGTFMVLGR